MIEEIFWKAKVYNPSFLASLNRRLNQRSTVGMGVSFLISRGDIYRFVHGRYVMPEQIHLRPLSKMIQDVVKELIEL